MEYRLKADLLNDRDGYKILFDALDAELNERGICAKADRSKGSAFGLIELVPFPKKNNAKLIEELKNVPAFIECKTVRSNLSGEIQMMVHATFNGLRLLKYRDPEAEIIFYKEKEKNTEKQAGTIDVIL